MKELSPRLRYMLNGLITVGSVVLCLLLLPTRFPGMELLGMGPNWLLIWVVAWSIKRTTVQAAIAGGVLGVIQDSLTAAYPSHALSLALVGVLTVRMQKQRYIREDFISVALIVFGMVVIEETVIAIQYSVLAVRSWAEISKEYQQVVLASAILSSLWAPVLYYPLNQWWEQQTLFSTKRL